MFSQVSPWHRTGPASTSLESDARRAPTRVPGPLPRRRSTSPQADGVGFGMIYQHRHGTYHTGMNMYIYIYHIYIYIIYIYIYHIYICNYMCHYLCHYISWSISIFIYIYLCLYLYFCLYLYVYLFNCLICFVFTYKPGAK